MQDGITIIVIRHTKVTTVPTYQLLGTQTWWPTGGPWEDPHIFFKYMKGTKGKGRHFQKAKPTKQKATSNQKNDPPFPVSSEASAVEEKSASSVVSQGVVLCQLQRGLQLKADEILLETLPSFLRLCFRSSHLFRTEFVFVYACDLPALGFLPRPPPHILLLAAGGASSCLECLIP